VRPGDVLIGYGSTGLHTNGYTLARRIAFDDLGLDVDTHVEALGTTVGSAFLAIHRSYWPALRGVLDRVHGLAHITGGGIPGNLVRSLPEGCGAVIQSRSWEVPPLFRWLVDSGRLSFEERYRVFNMGVGMIAAVPPADVDPVRSASDGPTWVIGEVTAGVGVRIAP
jgi:phosphoribosylformylglycinamidine cyclo-ligase